MQYSENDHFESICDCYAEKNFSEGFFDLQIHQKLLQAHPRKLFTHDACKKIAKCCQQQQNGTFTTCHFWNGPKTEHGYLEKTISC